MFFQKKHVRGAAESRVFRPVLVVFRGVQKGCFGGHPRVASRAGIGISAQKRRNPRSFLDTFCGTAGFGCRREKGQKGSLLGPFLTSFRARPWRAPCQSSLSVDQTGRAPKSSEKTSFFYQKNDVFLKNRVNLEGVFIRKISRQTVFSDPRFWTPFGVQKRVLLDPFWDPFLDRFPALSAWLVKKGPKNIKKTMFFDVF